MFHEVICFYKSLSCYSAANIQKKDDTCKRLTPISIELTKKCMQNDGKQFRFTCCLRQLWQGLPFLSQIWYMRRKRKS